MLSAEGSPAAPAAVDSDRAARRRAVLRYSPALAAVLLGLALSFWLFGRARDAEQARLRDQFAVLVQGAAGSVHAGLQSDIEILRSLGALYASSQAVERDEFSAFAQSALDLHRDIRALEWVPRVTRDQRQEFEAAARAAGLPGFRIVEGLGPPGEFVEAPARDDYFPIYYAEPQQANRLALGLDHAGAPDQREAMERARDSARPVATPFGELVRDAAGDSGASVFI
jgi:CHASE1-domain containing sensor protein